MTVQGPSEFVGNHPAVVLISCEYSEPLLAPSIIPSASPVSSQKPRTPWDTENCVVDAIIEFEGIKYSHVGTTLHVPGHFSGNVRYQDRIWRCSSDKTYKRAFHAVTAPGEPYVMPPPPHHPTYHCYVQYLHD
jgi:hypothetical protein